MNKLKAFCKAHREILLYLLFGVLTTVVSFAVYFLLLHGGVALLGEDAAWGVRVAAQILQWVAGVLFAFVTNKTYVFGDTNRERGHVGRTLAAFASSRVVTLLLDSAVTFGVVALLGALRYAPVTIPLPLVGGLTVTADLIAKALAAVVTIIGNYILSKFLVFRKR